LCGIARQFILFNVGNGENIFLWLHYWHPDWVLHETYGHRVIYDAGSKLDAKLSSVLRNNSWQNCLVFSEIIVGIGRRQGLMILLRFKVNGQW
jgi:hypothetical protein